MMREYKEYWIAFLGSAMTGSIMLALSPSTDSSLPLFLEIIFGTVLLVLLALTLAVIILAVSWIFRGDFTLLRFIRISVTVSIIMSLIYIISFFLELRRQ
jgi:hypothetical protein